MAKVLSAARAALAGGSLALAVLVGVALQATSALVTFTPGSPVTGDASGPAAAMALAEPGPRPVGMVRWPAATTPAPLTVWYPAQGEGDAARDPSSGVQYSYGIQMFGAGATVALATYPGRAVPGATPDLAGGPYPVVVLSPGFAISATSYAWLAEHLASYGFVVAAVQHDESLDPQALWRATVDRPRDLSAALDAISTESAPGGRLAGLADLDRVAVLGHSYGGYAALAAGGARLDTAALLAACESDGGPGAALALQCDGLVPHLDELAARAGLDAVPSAEWPSWADPRVDAVVALAGDAVMFGPDGLASLRVPVLAIGGTADVDSPFAWGTGAAFEQAAAARKVEVSLIGAEHLLFAGGCDAPRVVLRVVDSDFCSDVAWEPGPAHDVVAHYATAFLLAEVAGEAEARIRLAPGEQGDLPRVVYRAVGY